jgi:hypothetical protein
MHKLVLLGMLFGRLALFGQTRTDVKKVEIWGTFSRYQSKFRQQCSCNARLTCRKFQLRNY